MELTLFLAFISISLVLIGLGLFVREHTELSIIGFTFLFLLSMVLLTGTITQKVGYTTNTTCNYVDGNLTSTAEVTEFQYDPISWDGTLAHSLGYFMAVMSIVGAIGVFVGFRRGKDDL